MAHCRKARTSLETRLGEAGMSLDAILPHYEIKGNFREMADTLVRTESGQPNGHRRIVWEWSCGPALSQSLHLLHDDSPSPDSPWIPLKHKINHH